MKFLSVYLLVLTIFIKYSYADDLPNLVIELFRHGARSDSEVNDTTWADHDELTPVGMRQHYILGKLLAERYPHILGTFDANKIYVRSTNFNRTLMSAAAQLQGIFEGMGPSLPDGSSPDLMIPPYANTTLVNEILANLSNTTAALPNNLQLVTINTADLNNDELLYGGPGTCPTSAQWFKDKPTDDQAQKVFDSLSTTTKALGVLGQNMKQLDDYFQLGDMLVADHFSNKSLPPGIEFNSSVYNDTVFGFQWFTNYVYTGTGPELRVNCYLLVNTIIDWFDGVVNGTNHLEFIMLSSHDTTLLRLLGLYNITHPDCLAQNHQSMVKGTDLPFPNCIYPSYASQVILELYNSTTEEPYVKVLYESEPMDICTNGQYKCTLKDFKTLSSRLLDLNYDDYLTICGINHNNNDNPKSHLLTIILLTIVGILVIAIIAVVVIYFLRKKQVGMRIRTDDYNRIDAEQRISINE